MCRGLVQGTGEHGAQETALATTTTITTISPPAPQSAPPLPTSLVLRVAVPPSCGAGGAAWPWCCVAGRPGSLPADTVFSPARLWLAGGGDRKTNKRKLNFGHVKKDNTEEQEYREKL